MNDSGKRLDRFKGQGIRYATPLDIRAMVAIHMLSFERFFLTFLGPPFLKELYTATLQEPSGIALIADEGGVVAGFVTGTVEPSGFYTRLLRRRWWRFALCCAVPLLRRPAIAPRLLRAFSVPGQNAHKQDRATLMSIAVTPECQGTGVGRALVRAFVLEAWGRGRHCVDLTTDLENNRKVNNFYLRMGFVCERTFATPEGRAMNEYIISRSAANEGSFNLIPGQWPP